MKQQSYVQTDDGHDTSCTWQKCAHPESKVPCPFVGEPFSTVATIKAAVAAAEVCTHDWRQLVTYPNNIHFYCTKCLATCP